MDNRHRIVTSLFAGARDNGAVKPFELVSPPRRMPTQPALTIQAPSGLSSGECWWLGMDTLSFLCPERLETGTWVELRLDPGAGRPAVFMRARVDALAQGRHPRGYLHAGPYTPAGRTSLDQVEGAVRSLNPQAAPRRRDPLAAIEQDLEQRGRRLPGTIPPADSARPPAPGPVPGLRFDRGPPASLLVELPTRELVRTHSRLDRRMPRLVLPAVPGPRRGELLLVAIRLPSGLFLQSEAEVGHADGDTLELRLQGDVAAIYAQLSHEAR